MQPSFPDCTGIVQTKWSLPDRAESSSLAESAASATNEESRCIRSPEALARTVSPLATDVWFADG